MSDRSVVHSTFTLERTYPATPARVFAAWADPAAKARWFGRPDTEHELDFRVGGSETVVRPAGDGVLEIRFESSYRDIVADRRIVYVSTMYSDGEPVTVSLTSVQFSVADDGATRLELTEHGAYLDGQEQPSWRERGTNEQLDQLGAELRAGTEADR
jgi:uncharacterized protein YndB with AHSA1/START domain